MLSEAGYLELLTGGASPIIRPFVGVANQAVRSYVGAPAWVLTVENLTTLHLASRVLDGRPALILFIGGMPSPSWIAAFRRILRVLPLTVPAYHWEDIDQGGFRIAARIRLACIDGRPFHSWLMDARQVDATARKCVPPSIRNAMVRSALAAGWTHLAETMIYITAMHAEPSSEGRDRRGTRSRRR